MCTEVEKLKVILFCFFCLFVTGSCRAEAGFELLTLPPPLQCWDHRPQLPYLALYIKERQDQDGKGKAGYHSQISWLLQRLSRALGQLAGAEESCFPGILSIAAFW